MGCYINAVSILEYEIDQFLFSVTEFDKHLAKSLTKKFPSTTEKKVEFICQAFERRVLLRNWPIYCDGFLCMNHFYFGCLELFEVRNILAHGATDVVRRSGVDVYYESTKLARDVQNKSQFFFTRHRVPSPLLEILFVRAKAFSRYVAHLRSTLTKNATWEIWYKNDKILRSNRTMLRDMGFNIPTCLDDGDLEITLRSAKAQASG